MTLSIKEKQLLLGDIDKERSHFAKYKKLSHFANYKKLRQYRLCRQTTFTEENNPIYFFLWPRHSKNGGKGI